ncbi:MAG: metal-dependent transcriptional regulator [Crenarchaeota archaeon]|nr:metal-dependent transcriptional regulator [Thermoproteota archaeon]
MEIDLSYGAEEYIETIYRLQKRFGIAKTNSLAKALGVVPGSITNTIEHLESHNLVVHKPYQGVKLTKQGEKIALNLIRKHRLAERLLTDVLNAHWSTVHEDACKLEHAMTKNLVNLLDERLGHPKFCPHGNPIPTENGLIEEQQGVVLTETDVGENYLITNIIDGEKKDLEILAKKNMYPGVKILIKKIDPQEIFFQTHGITQSVNTQLASIVMVRKIEAT